MKRTCIVLALAFCLCIEIVYARSYNQNNSNWDMSDLHGTKSRKKHGKKGKRKHRKYSSSKAMKALLGSTQKEGIFISSYVGDGYISIVNGKIMAVKSIKDATLFDIDIKSEKATSTSPLSLEPWVQGIKNLISYNSVGEDINVDVPVASNTAMKSDSTIFYEVIGKRAKKPVFEIKSESRSLCFTLDATTKEYKLSMCSTGGNDLQSFRFMSYKEALKSESRRKGRAAFDIKDYLADTYLPAGVIMVTDKLGVIYLG
ncbi:hypothetical protein NEOKW01_1358 [Nematocida sp. AWRm80]|nr:hypothetical protein NEOKW01_1358 [Nematocida sp. AWRm80]